MPVTSPVVDIHAVSHAYGDRTVLRDVSLRLTERRIGIIGANGSGKSTFARLLNGLIVPTSGRVTVDALDTRRDGARIRRRVGFVFTDPDAQIVMPTVAEDVAFGLRRLRLTRDETERRVAAALSDVGLADHADHPAHLLSGGQKQLLALASVLVTEPEVLVCDEPTTLLDRRNARRMMDRLTGLPHTVILVTHDLGAAARMERVIVFDEGAVVYDGAAAAAIDHYCTLVDPAGTAAGADQMSP